MHVYGCRIHRFFPSFHILESTCDQARPHESVQLESLREQVKTMESAVQQKEETITQLTKECAKLKEELEKQEADHDLQVLTVQENLTQALKTNEALNLEVQQLRTSQSEQVELRMKLMKQHASDLDVKRQEIDALKVRTCVRTLVHMYVCMELLCVPIVLFHMHM